MVWVTLPWTPVAQIRRQMRTSCFISGDAVGVDGDSWEFAHQTWPAQPAQLTTIRTQVRRWLAPLDLAEDAEDDIVLSVSEAATNSVEHAYVPATPDDTVRLTFWTEPPCVHIEIVDHGTWLVPSSEPNGRGRGIEIMRHLMAVVSIQCDSRGTRVLLSYPLTAQPAAVLDLASDGA